MLKRYLFFLIIPAVLLTCVLPGCTHSNKNVPPTGWMSMGEPYDSLIRRLELGFNGDMPDDSLRYYCKLYQSAAEADGSPLQLSRAAFWRGRMAFRDGQ